MQSHVSDIVVSTAGRDAGGHFLVLREDETFLPLAGKRQTQTRGTSQTEETPAHRLRGRLRRAYPSEAARNRAPDEQRYP